MEVLMLDVTTFLLFYAVSMTVCQSLMSDSEFEEEYPDINDLFISKSTKNSQSPPPIPIGHQVKNISINLEKLNVSKFLQKLDTFKYYVIGNVTQQPETDKDSRRLLDFILNPNLKNRLAAKYQYRTKILDIMLQTLFMAKHKMQEIESYVDTNDVSYRVSFTYERLKKIRNYMEDVYLTMLYYSNFNEKNAWVLKTGVKKCLKYNLCGPKPERVPMYRYVNPRLRLHQWVVKLHTDFLYLYWTMIKLHESYCRHNKCYSQATTPFNVTTTEEPFLRL